MARINKTENNLKIVWQQLDNASGELYNALDNLYHMTDLSDHTKRLMEMIDISRIDLLKEQIEGILEQKKEKVVQNYTEEQYLDFLGFMDRMIDVYDIVEGAMISAEMKEWQSKEGLSEEVIDMMGERLEREEREGMEG